MKDPKNLTIAMLCVSAAILATALLLLPAADEARADTPVRGGDYIMVTGAYSSLIDLLYVVDRSEQKLNAYVLDLTRGDLLVKSQINLKLTFRRARAAAGD